MKSNTEKENPKAKQPSAGRETLFILVHQLLKPSVINMPVALVVFLIEAAQLAQFSVPHDIVLFSEFSALNLLESILKCSTLGVFYEGNPQAFITLTICNLFIVISFLLMVGRLLYALHPSRRSNSLNSLDNALIRIVDFIFFLFRTVYLLPLMELLFIGFSGNIQEEHHLSLSGHFQIFLKVAAGLTGMLYSLYLAMCLFLLNDPNPFTHSPFQGPLNSNQIILTLLKICVGVYRHLNFIAGDDRVFLLITPLVYVVLIAYRVMFTRFTNSHIEKFCLMLEAFILWFSLLKLFQHEFDEHASGSLIQEVAALIVLVLAVDFLMSSRLRRLFATPLASLKSDEEVEFYIRILLREVENIGKPANRINLEGVLGMHAQQCPLDAQKCQCSYLGHIKKRGNLFAEEMHWHFFILGILQKLILQFPKSQRLMLLISYIQKQKLQKKFNALYSLSKCQNLRTNLTYNLLSYHIRQNIQSEMNLDDINLNRKNKIVNVNKFYEFNKLVVKFEKNIQVCVRDHAEFWSELLEKSLDVQRIDKLGTDIIRGKQQILQLYTQLNALNSNNIHLLYIYGYFMLNIANDDGSQFKFLEKVDAIRRNSNIKHVATDQHKVKYGQNSQTAIFVISGDQLELGNIVNLNSEVKTLLGWSRKDLLGQNISIIMPMVFGQKHNVALSKYLSNSKQHFIGLERIAPAFTKEGFMLICTAMTKSLANIENGIQIIGFLSEFKEDHEDNDKVFKYILYRSDTQIVQGITQNCQAAFDIPGALVYGHPLNKKGHELRMNQIFTDSPQRKDIKQALKTRYYCLKINTTQLVSNLPIEQLQYDFGSMESEQSFTLPRGVQMNVLVKLKQEKVYFDTPLVLLGMSNEETKAWKNQGLLQSQHTRRRQIENSFRATINNNNQEEIKHIKDFKKLISEKSEPFSVRIVNNLSLWLALILCVLSFLSYWYFQEREDLYGDAVSTVSMNQFTSMMISEEAYFLRKFHVYNTYYENFTEAESIRGTSIQNVSELNPYLQAYHFILAETKRKIEKFGCKSQQPAKSLNFDNISHLLLESSSSLNTELYNFVGEVYELLSFNESQFKFELFQPAFQQSEAFETFFLNLYNALFYLVNSIVETTENIYLFYNCQLNGCSSKIQIILGVALGLLLVVISMMVPYVVSVNNINNRVLSLFGFIPSRTISQLMQKCGKYVADYLIQAQPLELSLKLELNMQESHLIASPLGPMSPLQIKSPLPLLHQRTRKLSRNNHTQERNEQELRLQQKNQQFTQSSNKNLFRIITQYSIMFVFLAAYFLTDYFLARSIFSSMQLGLENSYYYQMRLQQMRHLKTCSIEAYIDPSLKINSTNTIRNVTFSIIDNVYQTERKLLSLDQAKIAPEYAGLLWKINKDNVCSGVENQQENFNFPLQVKQLTESECTSIQSGLFQRGLQTVIVSIAEQIRVDLTNSTFSFAKKKGYLHQIYQKAEAVQKYMQYPLFYTLKKQHQSLNQKFQTFRLISLGKMVVFVLAMAGLYVFLWLPYRNDLNLKIWRTKGMLNMIPMSIILKTERLKHEFTSGKLEKAVR